MDSTDRRDDLAELRTRVEEALAADDVVVEQVRATGTAEHRTVEVVLDRASGTQGLSLDDVARLSGRVLPGARVLPSAEATSDRGPQGARSLGADQVKIGLTAG